MAYSRWERTAYQVGQTTPYMVSRSKIEFYLQCPRCFWLDQRLKIKRPSTPPFLINSAVDELFKNEFDTYRAKGAQHPLQKKFKVDAKPFAHKDLDNWRNTFKGVRALHEPTNLLVFGAVDDVWVTPKDELIVVDYKATAKKAEVKELGPIGGWHDAYRRQMEVYQWLLRRNDFNVSDTGYFVYANGIADKPAFDNKVEFRTNVFPYEGDARWVDKELENIKACLEGELPKNSEDCEYCNYTADRLQLTLEALAKRKAKVE